MSQIKQMLNALMPGGNKGHTYLNKPTAKSDTFV